MGIIYGLTFWNRAETGLLSPKSEIQILEAFAYLRNKVYHDEAAVKDHLNQTLDYCPVLQ